MDTRPSTAPTIVARPEQAYVGMRRAITMSTFPEIADRIPEVFEWLASRGIAPSGPSFLRFNLIDMDRALVVEAGVPVPAAVTAEGDVFCDVLPAGRYATVTHVGHPDELIDVTGALERLPGRRVGAVERRPEQREDRAFGDVQVDALEHDVVAERLAQPGRRDRR